MVIKQAVLVGLTHASSICICNVAHEGLDACHAWGVEVGAEMDPHLVEKAAKNTLQPQMQVGSSIILSSCSQCIMPAVHAAKRNQRYSDCYIHYWVM
jgi:hypothetical protein